MRWTRILALATLAITVLATQSRGEGVVAESIHIPAVFPGTLGSRTDSLEAVVLRPDDGKPHPLALVNHGSPRVDADRAKMTPSEEWPQAMEFARRGWTAVSFMRRGYGYSEGGFAEDSGHCGEPYYDISGNTSAQDLAAAAKYMATQPYVSGGPMISVGVSAGAFATIAFTADPPPNLAAAIAFAPGQSGVRRAGRSRRCRRGRRGGECGNGRNDHR